MFHHRIIQISNLDVNLTQEYQIKLELGERKRKPNPVKAQNRPAMNRANSGNFSHS